MHAGRGCAHFIVSGCTAIAHLLRRSPARPALLSLPQLLQSSGVASPGLPPTAAALPPPPPPAGLAGLGARSLLALRLPLRRRAASCAERGLMRGAKRASSAAWPSSCCCSAASFSRLLRSTSAVRCCSGMYSYRPKWRALAAALVAGANVQPAVAPSVASRALAASAACRCAAAAKRRSHAGRPGSPSWRQGPRPVRGANEHCCSSSCSAASRICSTARQQHGHGRRQGSHTPSWLHSQGVRAAANSNVSTHTHTHTHLLVLVSVGDLGLRQLLQPLPATRRVAAGRRRPLPPSRDTPRLLRRWMLLLLPMHLRSLPPRAERPLRLPHLLLLLLLMVLPRCDSTTLPQVVLPRTTTACDSMASGCCRPCVLTTQQPAYAQQLAAALSTHLAAAGASCCCCCWRARCSRLHQKPTCLLMAAR